MALLVVSQFVMTKEPLAYGMLLLATASLGIGFGLTVPSLNTFAAAFFPEAIGRAVLILNALLGLGTALAPVFVAIFVGLGIWWGLPFARGRPACWVSWCSACRLPLQVGDGAASAGRRRPSRAMPARFWVFAGFALLYGIVETMNGNWATLYMTQRPGRQRHRWPPSR